MASSAESADVHSRPASLDSHFRLRSMDSQVRRTGGTNSQTGRVSPDGLKRRASLDGFVGAQIGSAAVIRYFADNHIIILLGMSFALLSNILRTACKYVPHAVLLEVSRVSLGCQRFRLLPPWFTSPLTENKTDASPGNG